MNKQIIKKAAITAGLAAASIIAAGQDTQQNTDKKNELSASPSSLEWHFADGKDKARINLFYNLPLNTSAYSFMEFYGKDGYFGKDLLYTQILKKQGVGLKTETSHALFTNPCGPEIAYNKVGIGLEKQAMLPGKIFASLKFLPLVFGDNAFENREMAIGYFASKGIEINDNMKINISSFLDFKLGYSGGPVSDYGETDITFEHKTRYGQFDYGVGVNHNVSGKLAPDNQFRVRLGFHPKK